ncbi:MAG: transglutaminase domain-containing protein [Planctomycetes bacterium]|nr:transglutaminase domain-containing protein [Planctomycetota bacterium]
MAERRPTIWWLGLALVLAAAGLAWWKLGRAQSADFEVPEREVVVTFEWSFRPFEGADASEIRVQIPVSLSGRHELLMTTWRPLPTNLQTRDASIEATFRWPEPPEGPMNIRAVLRLRLQRPDFAHGRPELASRNALEGQPEASVSDRAWLSAAAERIEAGRPEDLVRKLAEFVTARLEWSDRPGDARSVRAILEGGDADALSQARVLVALCRARGLKARLVRGLLLTGEGPRVHGWAEVKFDDRGWVLLDPARTRGLFRDAFDLENVYLEFDLPRDDLVQATGLQLEAMRLEVEGPGAGSLDFLSVPR